MLLPALLTEDAHLVIAPRCEVLAFWQGSNRNVAPAGGAREYDHNAHDTLRFFAVSAQNVLRLCEFRARRTTDDGWAMLRRAQAGEEVPLDSTKPSPAEEAAQAREILSKRTFIQSMFADLGPRLCRR